MRRARRYFLVGRLAGRSRGEVLRGYRAVASVAGEAVAQSPTDSSGRFLLEWARGQEPERVLVELLSGSGRKLAQELVPGDSLSSPRAVVFDPVARAPASGGRRAERVTLAADGDSPFRVEASCHPVRLEWRVPSRSSSRSVSLLCGTRVSSSGLPLAGAMRVTGRETHDYTLVAEGGGDVASATVRVARYGSLALFLEGVRFRAGSTISVGACVSCPAPKTGTTVTLVPGDARVSSGGTILIPCGSVSATAEVRLGGDRGRVELTGMAEGYLRDSVSIEVR